MRIAALSTGIGNVRSVVRALERVAPGACQIATTADPEVVRRADVIVVPGQGSFGAFADALTGGLREVLVARIAAGTPYLGICLGLQILFDESAEAPGARGLGIFRGQVRRLTPGIDPLTQRERALPHIGWNMVDPHDVDATRLLARAHYYFAHTYAAAPEDPALVLATSEYGPTFTSAVRKDNVVGVQFHPEKSQRAGLAFLERFFSNVVMVKH